MLSLTQDDMLDLHTIDRPGVLANSSDVWNMWREDRLGPAPFNGKSTRNNAGMQLVGTGSYAHWQP